MVDRLDRILDVFEVDQTGIEVRFRRRLFAPAFDHFEQAGERLGIAPLFLEREALLVERILRFRRERQTVSPAAARAEQQRAEREEDGD
eukprot:TRINITY_DN88859_c0_g1_i1.p3 TRINITY_DN88859_c0_g1~~TRINITY_DN88859_c0_g1_i1.p3  ORF type:complete len:102 (+),score=18.47 TRINITY_DN88859_c0_g1_i1:40-306(+)